MKFTLAILIAILTPLSIWPDAADKPFTAFADGETYVYRVSWGVFSRAGELTVSAKKDELEGRPVMRIVTQMQSRGIVRGIYRYDDTTETVVDLATSRILSSLEQGEDSKRRTEARTDFDYKEGIARHRDTHRAHRNTDLPIPEGDPVDLISALIAPREWDIQVGESRDVLVHSGRGFYLVTLRAEEIEEVKAPIGQFETLRLVPRMEKDEPRGLFAKGGEVMVWMSQDHPRLPVRMQLKLKYGTATLLLEEHRTIAHAAE